VQHYELLSEAGGGAVAATGSARIVLLDFKTGRKAAMPAELLAAARALVHKGA
jgi:acyl-CoA thioesterase FadM